MHSVAFAGTIVVGLVALIFLVLYVAWWLWFVWAEIEGALKFIDRYEQPVFTNKPICPKWW